MIDKIQLKIDCLNKAAKDESDMSYLSMLHNGRDVLSVVNKAMDMYAKAYALACLERAAQHAVVTTERVQCEPNSFLNWIVDKESITDEKNLI